MREATRRRISPRALPGSLPLPVRFQDHSRFVSRHISAGSGVPREPWRGHSTQKPFLQDKSLYRRRVKAEVSAHYHSCPPHSWSLTECWRRETQCREPCQQGRRSLVVPRGPYQTLHSASPVRREG